MSSVNVNTMPNPAAPASNMNERPKIKVYELIPKDLEKIPEEQKKALFAMPGEANSIWEEYTFPDGNKVSSTTTDNIIRNAHEALSLFINAQSGGYTHIAFGGFKFKYNSTNGKISRTPFVPPSPPKAYAPWTKTPAKPKFLADVYVDSVEGVRDFLTKPENKGKWETLRDPYISEKDERVIMFLARYQYD